MSVQLVLMDVIIIAAIPMDLMLVSAMLDMNFMTI